ncbi:hypothetical protein D9758_004621 [Tetrapyrgos nigripes]|uniref:DUF6697 domain-containing protein n=1 Tax=Tetrapyrgos nigripes TaxID=182062 RepID=A0A8H5H072_9AGAR|nr:hypothetical protein D9758_004621 [Tetrapyrgos nigripes]
MFKIKAEPIDDSTVLAAVSLPSTSSRTSLEFDDGAHSLEGSEDVDHDSESPSGSTNRAPKRRRIELQGVFVRVFDQILRSERRKRELKRKFKKLKNPKAKMTKIEEKMMLSDEAFHSRLRLEGIQLDPMPINLIKTILDIPVRREFMRDRYGGSAISCFPGIAQERVDQHGYSDFMYLNMKYHPNAPQVPGAPGLFYNAGETNEDWTDPSWGKKMRVFTRLESGVWLKMGIYDLFYSKPLSREEWSRDDMATMRTAWAKKLFEKDWGRRMRCSIKLRKSLKREPTPEELKEAMATKDDFKAVTADDIGRAFMRGEEVVSVWAMKCVDYDVDFQKTIVEAFGQWTKPAPKKSAKSKGNPGPRPKATKVSTSSSSKTSKKRKAQEMEEENSDDDEYDPVYVPRGTRSRPVA